MAKKEKAVVVTTSHRGVFFGYATDTSGESITLKQARNCIYWRGIKGFIALAESGPTKECRVGPPANSMEIRDITSVIECTPAAAKEWERGYW